MEFSLLELVTTLLSVLGVSGCGIMFYRENKRAKQLENEASSNNEWIKLYREVKDELSAQRDAKIELRNEIMELRVEVTELKAWRCLRTNCSKRRPPSAVTMTDDHTND